MKHCGFLLSTNFWTAFGAVGAAAAAIATAVSVFLAYNVYGTAVQQARVEASVEYSLRFMAGEILQAQVELRNTLTEFPAIRLARTEGGGEVIDDSIVRILRDPNRTVDDSLITLVSFFDAAGRCVEGRVCDAATLCAQIGDQVASIQNFYGGGINYLRKERGFTLLGDGLTALAITSECQAT